MPAHRSSRRNRSLGPLSDEDPELRDTEGRLLHKDAARTKNNSRLREALMALVPRPDIGWVGVPPSHQGHRLGPLQMSVGATRDDTIGSWYQLCFGNRTNNCRAAILRSLPIHDAAQRFENTDVPRLLAIREELKATLKHIRRSFPPSESQASVTPSSSTPERPMHARRASDLDSSQSSVASSSSAPIHHATAFWWTQDGHGPVAIDLTPRDRGLLQLTVHKLTLGEYGVEQMNRIQMYDTRDDRWKEVLWQDPIPFSDGQPILLKYETVNDPLGLELYVM